MVGRLRCDAEPRVGLEIGLAGVYGAVSRLERIPSWLQKYFICLDSNPQCSVERRVKHEPLDTVSSVLRSVCKS